VVPRKKIVVIDHDDDVRQVVADDPREIVPERSIRLESEMAGQRQESPI
jgi:hypothetical protein